MFVAPRLGSPPRMRGKVDGKADGAAIPRITPAHAGKRSKIKCLRFPDRDHPRACGEKWTSDDFTVGSQGSPPRMRGKVEVPEISRTPTRITPAHAGKSVQIMPLKARQRDHPRACGEKAGRIILRGQKKGSPPRMRGKALQLVTGLAEGRITPAHAGKSPSMCRRPAPCWDHPRACGEK